MGGWVKIDKDLVTDPRVLRLARWYEQSDHGRACNACALHSVTLVSGALLRLWIYADSHARDDDSLELGVKEIDRLVGVPGFAAALPPDWLVELDEHRVELPGFQAHNGVDAKKRARTAKRVEQHRERVKRKSVTPSNASALPDQTRPDQTRPCVSTRNAHAREPVPVPRETSPPGAEETRHAGWLVVMAIYPPTPGRADWITAERAAAAAVAAGETTWPDLEAAVRRYAAYCRSTGRLVANPARWFGERQWQGGWDLPKPVERGRSGVSLEAERAEQERRDLLSLAKGAGLTARVDEPEAEFLARVRDWNARRLARLEAS